jgi:hypothetical protein
LKDKRPAFQFYVGDWMKDADLRACSYAARGLWTDMLCLMYESSRRGYLLVKDRPASQQHIARMTGGSSDEVGALLKELEDAGVFSRSSDGAVFCRRMVRDEAAAARARANGQKGGNPVLVGKSDKGGVIPDSNPPHKPRDKHFVEDEEEVEVEEEGSKSLSSVSSGGRAAEPFESDTPVALPPDIPGYFRVFNAYPQHRRNRRYEGEAAWRGMNLEPKTDAILAGLEAWKASDQWREGMVERIDNFLKNSMWENAPTEATHGPDSRNQPHRRPTAEDARRAADRAQRVGGGDVGPIPILGKRTAG